MIRDCGKAFYSPASVHIGREYVDFSFRQKGLNISISCKVLEQGLTRHSEVMRYRHPQPPFSRFFIFLDDGADVTIPSGKLRLIKGNIYHLPPNQPFDITYDISRLIFLHLHITDISGQSLFWDTKGIPKIEDPDLSSRYLQGYENDDKMQILSAIIDTLRILIKPKLDSIAQRAEQTKKFSSIFNYLQEKQIAKVTIAELSELCSKTPDTLSKQFFSVMGTSLKKFLIERQLLQAQELLLHSPKNISEIAEELGHSSSQYFHRFFKKHCLCTPREYRDMNRSINLRI